MEKFRIGDWIVDKSGCTQQVLDFRCGVYTCTYNSFTTDCESNYHLWAFGDVKDGDILAVTMYPGGTWIGMFKKKEEQDDELFSSYCFVSTVGAFKLNGRRHGHGEAIYPATEAQRNRFFQSMKEAGYCWDSKIRKIVEI